MKDWDSIVRDGMRCDNPDHMKIPHEMRHLFIYKNQILLDVQSQISMVNGSRKKEDGTENTELEMTEKYKAQFDRWIDRYVDNVKERLVLVLFDLYNTALGDELKDWSEKRLCLKFPSWWDDTAWRPLVSCVHEYIVSGVMWEWAKIALTSKDPFTADKAEDVEKLWAKMRNLQAKHKPGSIRRSFSF